MAAIRVGQEHFRTWSLYPSTAALGSVAFISLRVFCMRSIGMAGARGVKYVKRNGLAGRRFTSWEDLNDWLERWSAEAADTRIHGTTYGRPADRFANQQLTPLGARLPYRYERVQQRRVANDALGTVGAGRYSVPAAYAGQTVSVHEGLGRYEFFPS